MLLFLQKYNSTVGKRLSKELNIAEVQKNNNNNNKNGSSLSFPSLVWMFTFKFLMINFFFCKNGCFWYEFKIKHKVVDMNYTEINGSSVTLSKIYDDITFFAKIGIERGCIGNKCVNIFHKKLHHKCVIGSRIRLWKFMQAISQTVALYFFVHMSNISQFKLYKFRAFFLPTCQDVWNILNFRGISKLYYHCYYHHHFAKGWPNIYINNGS